MSFTGASSAAGRRRRPAAGSRPARRVWRGHSNRVVGADPLDELGGQRHPGRMWARSPSRRPAQHEPQFQRPEAPARAAPASPGSRSPRRIGGRVAQELRQHRQRPDQRRAVGHPERVAVEVGEQPLVRVGAYESAARARRCASAARGRPRRRPRTRRRRAARRRVRRRSRRSRDRVDGGGGGGADGRHHDGGTSRRPGRPRSPRAARRAAPPRSRVDLEGPDAVVCPARRSGPPSRRRSGPWAEVRPVPPVDAVVSRRPRPWPGAAPPALATSIGRGRGVLDHPVAAAGRAEPLPGGPAAGPASPASPSRAR